MPLSRKTLLVHLLMLPALLVSGMYRVLHFHPSGHAGGSASHLLCSEMCCEDAFLVDEPVARSSTSHNCSHGCEVVKVTRHATATEESSSGQCRAGEAAESSTSPGQSLHAVDIATHAGHCILCQILGAHTPSTFQPMVWLEFDSRQFIDESCSESAHAAVVFAYSCRGPPSALLMLA